MRLTQFTDYGLRTLMYLESREDEYVHTEEIARLFGVSWDHLLKVIRRLCELGYVEAKRGPSGGVRFLPATRRVTIGTIVRALESQLELVECFDPGTNTCPLAALCRLAPLLRRASEAFLHELDRVTLGELMDQTGDLRRALGAPRPPRAARAKRPGTRRSIRSA